MSAAASRYLRENFADWALSRRAAALAYVVAAYVNGEGFTWLSDATVAERMVASVATVERARRELRAKGVYVIAPGDGRGNATVYALPSTVLKAITGDGLSGAKGHHPARQRSSSGARKVITGDGPRSLVVDPGRARVPWCDATCSLCHGVGWIEQRAANGDPINIAEPCPNRQ